MRKKGPNSLIARRNGSNVSAFYVDDLNHALRNPLMLIRGHTDQLRRAFAQKTPFTAAGIRALSHDLAAIDLAVSNLVAVLKDLDQPSVDGPGTWPPHGHDRDRAQGHLGLVAFDQSAARLEGGVMRREGPKSRNAGALSPTKIAEASLPANFCSAE